MHALIQTPLIFSFQKMRGLDFGKISHINFLLATNKVFISDSLSLGYRLFFWLWFKHTHTHTHKMFSNPNFLLVLPMKTDHLLEEGDQDVRHTHQPPKGKLTGGERDVYLAGNNVPLCSLLQHLICGSQILEGTYHRAVLSCGCSAVLVDCLHWPWQLLLLCVCKNCTIWNQCWE